MKTLSAVLTLCLFFGLAALPASAQTWVDLSPASGVAPAPRAYAGAVYDAPAHRLIVFGGRGADGDLNDVWAFDLAAGTWTELTPASGEAPTPRRTPGVGHDAENRRMIVWSGQGAGLFSDVWAFDLERHTWTAFATADPRPNDRYGVASAFDPVGKRVVTFAGFTDQGRFEDTWAFDPAGAAWTDLSPADGNPGRRCLHAGAYDSRRHRLLIYGGQRTGALDDVWAFDLTAHTWADLTPNTRPAGRYFPALAYESRNDRLLLFGGNRGGGRTNEAWTFDLESERWQLLEPQGTAPSEREGPVAVYIEAEDRMVVFGGRGAAYGNDVWALEGLSTITPVETIAAPGAAGLEAAYPNPFVAETAVAFTLARASEARVTIYDLLGRAVARPIEGRLPAGRHTMRWTADGLPGGVYLIRLEAEGVSRTRRVVLAR